MTKKTGFRRPGARWTWAAILAVAALPIGPAQASDCGANVSLSSCFDANSLWLPAGQASFVGFSNARVNAVKQLGFGAAVEWFHRPVVLHVSSPDRDGREVNALESAVDASLFAAFGVVRNLELTLTLPVRVYETGAGSGGLASQTAPALSGASLRNPRLGLGYSLSNALSLRNLGLRAALDASVPVGIDRGFAAEHSLVVMPSLALSARAGRFSLGSSLGARLRKAHDFGNVRLGNQAFFALGVGFDALGAGLLFVGLEAYALAPLASSHALGNSAVSAERLMPAEWLASIRSSFRARGSWTLSVAAGTGIPLSSETRRSSGASSTAHFDGLTTPDFRSLLILRYAPPEPMFGH